MTLSNDDLLRKAAGLPPVRPAKRKTLPASYFATPDQPVRKATRPAAPPPPEAPVIKQEPPVVNVENIVPKPNIRVVVPFTPYRTVVTKRDEKGRVIESETHPL